MNPKVTNYKLKNPQMRGEPKEVSREKKSSITKRLSLYLTVNNEQVLHRTGTLKYTLRISNRGE